MTQLALISCKGGLAYGCADVLLNIMFRRAFGNVEM